MLIKTKENLEKFLKLSAKDRGESVNRLELSREELLDALSHLDLPTLQEVISQCDDIHLSDTKLSKLNMVGFEVLKDAILQRVNIIDLESDNYETLESILLSQCKALQKVYINTGELKKLNSTRLKELGSILSRCKELRTISLYNHQFALKTADLVALENIFSQCKKLHELNLKTVFAGGGSDLEAFGKFLTCFEDLHTIDLSANSNSGCALNADDRFEALYKSLEKCETLCEIIGIEEFNPEQKIRLNEMLDRHKAVRVHKVELKNRVSEMAVPIIKDPEWLFYDSQKKIVEFTANDTGGDVELERLWQGHDAIYKKQISEGRKKRALILNDFTAKQWSVEKKTKVKHKLLSLISKGFDVYVYQDQALLKLSAHTIVLLDSLEFEIPPVQNRKIDDLMRAINVPKSQIAYLDTAHLKELLGELLAGITIEELAQSGYSLETLKMHLNTEMPVPPVFNTIYSNVGGEKREEILLDALRGAVAITDKFVKISHFLRDEAESEDALTLLLQQNADTLKHLNLRQHEAEANLTGESILKVKGLESFYGLHTRMAASTLTYLLKSNNHLRELDIKSLRLSEDGESSEKIFALKQLKCLKISCLIKKDFRDAILKSSQNLEVLEFYGKPNSGDLLSSTPTYEEAISISDASELSLKHLEKLIFDGDLFVTNDTLSRILSQAQGLKELCLKFSGQNSSTSKNKSLHQLKVKDFPEGSLTKVKKLTVDAFAVESNNLTAILEKTLSLEDLNIVSLDMKITAETIPDRVLKNLKVVYFGRVNFNETEFSTIFKKMTKLESLTIENDFAGFKGFTPECLPISMLENLQSIYVSMPKSSVFNKNLSVYISLYEHILKHAKKLNVESRKLMEHMLKITKRDAEYEKQMILKKEEGQIDAINATASHLRTNPLARIGSNLPSSGQAQTLLQGSPNNLTDNTPFSHDTAKTDNKRKDIAFSGSQASRLEQKDNKPVTEATSSVDFDTSNDTKSEFNVRKIFKGIGCPDPSDHFYRLEIFDKVDITKNPTSPFTLSNPSPDETLKACNPSIKDFDLSLEVKQEAEFKYYRGKAPITINQQAWTPLPSLSAKEILTHLRATSPDGELIKGAYEIQYSERDNLYYIRSTVLGEHKINIEFLLKKASRLDDAEMPEVIKNLVIKYNAYKDGKLVLPPKPSGQDVLSALQSQNPGVGACRHRAVAFKKEVEALPSVSTLPVRIIQNASHAFVEVQAKSGIWVCYDLGGYLASTHLFDENGNLIQGPETTENDADSQAEADAQAAVQANDTTATPTRVETKEKIEAEPKAQSASLESTEEKDLKELKTEGASAVVLEIISEEDLEGNPLKTWEDHTKIVPKNDLSSYLLDIAQGTSPVTNSSFIKGDPLKKILVKLDSEEGTDAFRLLIQKQMLSLSKQVYYINSPEDLVCSTPWTERNLKTNTGILRPAAFPPGDKLRKFLNAKHPNPALVVNWSNFKAEDIVKFNSLLDKKRKADGVDVPDNTLIVGLYTKKPGAYNGADFFSRSDAVITLPFNDEELIAKAKDLQKSHYLPTTPATEEVALEQKTEQKEQIVIDLYESSNWKGILLGKWCLQGKNLVFEEGSLETKLSEAFKTGKEIAFKNAPWELEEFKIFWQQARLHKKIEAYGKTINIPDNFKVHALEGYEWEALLKNVRWDPTHEESTRVTQKSAGSERYILNPMTFNQYFKNYQSIAGDQVALKLGWIENAVLDKRGDLSLLLTRELSQHQWAQLLATAQKHQVTLNIRVVPGVSLPASFPESDSREIAVTLHTIAPEGAKIAESLSGEISLQALSFKKGHVLMTEDIDYAIAVLKDRYPKNKHPSLKDIKIIDISECESRHLLVSRTPLFNKKTLDYKFIQKISPALEALEKGETVVLKGHFEEDLVDALASLCSDEPHFWLNGKRLIFSGKLVLVTDDKPDTQKHFSFASSILLPSPKADAELFALLESDTKNRYLPKFSKEQIKSAVIKTQEILGKLSREPAPESEKYSFVKLQSIVEHQLCFPGTNPAENWQGLSVLKESTGEIIEAEELFNAKTAAKESNAFEQKRLNQINDTLKSRSFVFIAGSTGVGKSTFIKKILATQPDHHVFFENQLQTWAANKTPDVNKTLFIDEANIDKGNFSAFEGLFETPPRILIGNAYYELTPQHKVIFAGNPVSYGSRQMPELFARRGGSIIFDPLSPAYLYSEVLKPILTNRLTEEAQEIVGKKLLQLYQHISRLPSERILISPRELQMMTLLVVKKHQEIPQPPIDVCVAYAAHTISAGIVPENHKADFNRWCTTNGFETPILLPPPAPFPHPGQEQSTAFVVTQSRNPAYNQILDFLSIRTQKQESNANDTFKYAGLGGIVLEGEPGVGKSHFVVDTLVSQGFKEAHWKLSHAEPIEPAAQWHKNAGGQFLKQRVSTQQENKVSQEQSIPLKALAQKIFYIMPVSMEAEEKKKLLLKAFDEGAIVVIDEINSSPMMEDLLNDLLMGIYGNKRPTCPGFMVIGTQNPISMEGRIAASTALERRLFKVIFPQYNPLEMKEILQNKGLDLSDSEMLAEQYRKARQYAIQNNKNPAPTFRDLLKIAEIKLGVFRDKTHFKKNSGELSEAQLHWLSNRPKKAVKLKEAKNDKIPKPITGPVA